MTDIPPPPFAAPAPAPKTVPMFNPDNGMTGDIHPAEVENMRAVGWRMKGEAAQAPVTNGVEMSDADLRKAIFDATGERPGPNTKRETLLEKYNASASK